ncbi:uncharacterized protein TNCV_597381 [Trichonephila clavipes]|nr:uncharacterized protein TNCV_597381 [Trichonephila clavipes]
MTSLWTILALFGYHGLVSCQRDASECYEDMQRDSDISHLLLDVTSPERIDYFCGRISRLKKCVADYEDELSNAENTEYLQKTRGITAFYLNVCPPGTDITQRLDMCNVITPPPVLRVEQSTLTSHPVRNVRLKDTRENTQMDVRDAKL